MVTPARGKAASVCMATGMFIRRRMTPYSRSISLRAIPPSSSERNEQYTDYSERRNWGDFSMTVHFLLPAWGPGDDI